MAQVSTPATASVDARLSALATEVASVSANVATLVVSVDKLVTALAQPAAKSAPAKPKAKSDAAPTFVGKAAREAGAPGFSCSCGRTGLRTAPKVGSFHTAPDGTVHTIA